MGFREVSVVEVRKVLRAWLEGAGLRKVAERAGRTARPPATDELIGLVVEPVRPARSGGHGAASSRCSATRSRSGPG
jgi:hypothetical protein